MGWFDAWGTDPDFTDPDAAELRYKEQIQTISAAKNWPAGIRDRLLQFPWDDNFDPSTAQQVYYRAWVQEPRIIADAGYNMGQLANYAKHRNALAELAEASGLTDQALDEADTTSILAAGFSQTGSDIVDLGKAAGDQLNPKKSPWPWVIGGVVALLVARELGLGDLLKERRS